MSAPVEGSPGLRLIQASWAGTVAFTVACALGVVFIDTVAPLVVGLSAAMFAAGCVLFFIAYAKAVSRSRVELIGIGGLYFLAGTAPSEVRRHLLGSFAVQCCVVVVVIAMRPFTSLVLGALAPMYGLGCAGVWGARYGLFPARESQGD